MPRPESVRVPLAVALGLLLAACPTIHTFPAAAQPIEFEASGTWTQAASSMRFPERVAGYRRVRLTRFDGAGANVGVGYDHEDPRALVAFTVYVRPADGAGAAALDGFDAELRQVLESHPGAELEGQVERTYACGSEPVPGRSAAFRYAEEFAGARRQVRSRLHVFERGGWRVKYRITYAQIQEQTAEVAVRRMLAEAPWGRLAD